MGFGPGGLDCGEVLADVYLYLDNETDDATRDKMKAHLHDCAPCLRHFGLEQDVISLISRKCGGDIAPTELRDRIRIRLTEVTIETAHVEYRAE
jgi:mycothiol system anti-sigma-R factor